MKQILIVDDDEHLLGIMSLILKEEGYDVIEAKNGKETLQALNKSNISLVITDIIMPDKEGL